MSSGPYKNPLKTCLSFQMQLFASKHKITIIVDLEE